MSDTWTTDHIPDLGGKTILVTGANGGLGYEAALHLARKGARVVLACRDLSRAGTAVDAILSRHAGASVEAMELDLANLASVRSFAEKFLASHGELHVLCNNAGVMALPRCETLDGFEMQLGTNHLGHFALTGLLVECLLATPGSRVVTMSSTMHKTGRMHFDDLQLKRRYRKWEAYAQSKLANLLFAYELQRRLETRGVDAISVACHPGYAATNLQLAGPRMEGSALMERLMGHANRLFSQSAEMGALPLVRASTADDVQGGEYYGPANVFETRGAPVRVSSSARSHDAESAARLWDVSGKLTGVRFEALAG
jgi:NAD(P)-dependent dehydrogenase (short-subunit alcohol dehydrogenase family)